MLMFPRDQGMEFLVPRMMFLGDMLEYVGILQEYLKS